MNIISDFKDYYDCVQYMGSYDKDDYVYRRFTEEIIDEKELFPQIARDCPRSYDDRTYIGAWVLFCGKLHWLLRSQIKRGMPITFEWDGFFLKPSKPSKIKKKKQKYIKVHKNLIWIKGEGYQTNFDANYRNSKLKEAAKKDYTAIHQELNSPIIIFENDPCEIGDRCSLVRPRYHTILLNPPIEHFVSVKDPYTTYMDLDRFISCFLTQQPEMITLSNDDRIEKRGFDLKTSFRKEKTKHT